MKYYGQKEGGHSKNIYRHGGFFMPTATTPTEREHPTRINSRNKKKRKKNASMWINSWLTCKFLCSELVTFNLTCWSPLRLPHFIVLASNITSPLRVDFLLSVCPQELGIHDNTSVVFSGDLFPDLSQTHAWMGEVRKQFEKNLAACSFLSDESSNAWLFNSMWCGAPGRERIERKMVISVLICLWLTESNPQHSLQDCITRTANSNKPATRSGFEGDDWEC